MLGAYFSTHSQHFRRHRWLDLGRQRPGWKVEGKLAEKVTRWKEEDRIE